MLVNQMKKWKLLPPPPEGVLKDCHLPPLLTHLLFNRGVTTPSEVEPFLAADERLQGDPQLLPDIAKAVARILRAVLNRELIAIYGDFDADGVTATTVLTEGLSQLGGRVFAYIPHRQEGHGLSCSALEEVRLQGASLVITVDCGTGDHREVEEARAKGLDLIITDHHRPTSHLPPALAVVNPQREDSSYPTRELAGVGVAFKLLQALYEATGRRSPDELLDLVALGTVADLVPLTRENRYLVRKGLEVLNESHRPGIQELKSQAGVKRVDTQAISHTLAPRLNAAGRVDHASEAYALLVATSTSEASELAARLERTNAERRSLTEKVLEMAERKLGLPVEAPILIVGDENFPAGVNGLVASKLVEKFYRPAVVLELGEETSQGSCRSIPEFDVLAALSECRELLTRFGGHAQAAGFILPTSNVEQLHKRLTQIALRRLGGLDLQPSIPIDAEIPLSSLNGEVFRLLERLEPFGPGNPVPTFLSRGVTVMDCQRVGENGEHLKLKLREGEISWEAIGFDLGSLSEQVTSSVDIVYNLGVDDWGGERLLRLEILDFR